MFDLFKKPKKPKYLDNGSYGCVISPAISCKDKNKTLNGKISKIFNKNIKAEKEFKDYQIIQKEIDPNKKFTVTLEDTCEINTSIIDEKEFNKCENFKNNNIKYKSKLKQLIYENGGITLDESIKTIPFKELFMKMDNIFAGLITLKDKNLCHKDIKPNNLLYNPSTKKMTIIDFGYLSQLNSIYDYNSDNYIFFNDNHFFYPPEFRLFGDYKNGNYKNINDFIKFNINVITALFKKINKEILIEILNNGLFEWISNLNLVKMEYLIKNSKNIKINSKYFVSYKLDIYSMGMTLLYLYLLSNNRDNIEINDFDNDFNKIIIKFILSIINLDSDKRFTADKACEEYRKIIINLKNKEKKSTFKSK